MPDQPVNIWELADLRTPWCVRVAATLRVAEHLQNGAGAVKAVASACSCDADALHSVLSHLARNGVFEEPEPGVFRLNEPARALLDPVTRLSLDLDGLGGRMALAWGTLLDYVRTGQPAYARLFGRPFFDDLSAHPRLSAEFDRLIGPEGHGQPSPDFEITGGWGAVRRVADVGGGTGAMLAQILRAHPHLYGILVDRPETVARSAAIFLAAGVEDRATTAGQSFFDPLPTGADVYILRGILNDWPDHEAAAILRRCAEAAGQTGRVVILKSVTPDEQPKELTDEMVLVGGRRRAITEFAALARLAGLRVIASGQQPEYYVVELTQ